MMTEEDIRKAAKIINDYINAGKEILLAYDYKTQLLSLVDKDTLLDMGCTFVKSFRDYMELPYKCIPENRINAIVLLRGGKFSNEIL